MTKDMRDIEVVADALYANGFPADQAGRAAELAVKALRDAVECKPPWPGPFPPDGMDPRAYEPRARYDHDDIGRIWVDWKAVSRALMKSWRWRSDFGVMPRQFDGSESG